MSVLSFKPRMKPQPIVTRAMYAEQRHLESRDNLIAARQSLELRIKEAVDSGEDVSPEDLLRAREMLGHVDALLTSDDIEWGLK